MVNLEAVGKLTPAQVRIIREIKKVYDPEKGGRQEWTGPVVKATHWPEHVLRQQLVFALQTVGAANMAELLTKYESYVATRNGDLVG